MLGPWSAPSFSIFGALLDLIIGTVDAIIAMVISVIFQRGIYDGLTRYSIRSGMTSSVFSRVMFGTTGSPLAALLHGAVAIFYGRLLQRPVHHRRDPKLAGRVNAVLLPL
jgi:cytosine/uracil/thiamine/allantoin permease